MTLHKYKMYVVNPVLRGHLWDKGIVVI